MSGRILGWVCGLAFVGWTCTAQAAVLMNEPFAYTVGNLSGQGGWTTGSFGPQVVAGNLSYADYGSSGAAVKLVPDNETVTKPLGSVAGGVNGGDIWIGVLYQDQQIVPSNLLNTALRVALLNGSTEVATIGRGGNVLKTEYGISPWPSAAFAQGSDTDTHLLLTRLAFGAGNVAVSVWFDPNLSVPLASPTATNTFPMFSFNTVKLYAFGNSAYPAVFDELRIGTTYLDVVPEPATLMLICCSAFAFLGRRRTVIK